MPVCMVLRNVECPASGVGEYYLPLGNWKRMKKKNEKLK